MPLLCWQWRVLNAISAPRSSRSLNTLHKGTIASLLREAERKAANTSKATTAVQVNGWIRTVRKQKRFSFIQVTDGSNNRGLQAVVPSTLFDDALLEGLGTGVSVSLTGQLVPKEGGARHDTQEMELQVEAFELLGACPGSIYPIQKKQHTTTFLRRNAHLRARTSTISSMLRLRDAMQQASSAFFESQDYHNVTMPLTTTSDCEGAGEVFTIMHNNKPFYNRPTYLSVSGQLHLEAIVVGGAMGRCWHLAPAFRAERSDTNRHLNEFWMCEAELAFTDTLDDVMQVVEGLVRAVADKLDQDVYRKEMEDIFPAGRETVQAVCLQKEPWKRITYAKAIEEVSAVHAQDPDLFQHQPSYDIGLKSEHERYIADKYGPTFVTDYPTAQKPFYMRKNAVEGNSPSETVACFDLLVPKIGELAGGSLREERLEVLEDAMIAKNMRIEDYEWYLDLRRYGTVKHGGFGLGWERFVSWLLNIENVRDTIAFPRGSEGSRF